MKEVVKANKEIAKKNPNSLKTTKVVGGWSGYSKYFYDTVIIETDTNKAVELKYEHGQLHIYRIDTGQII